MEKDNNSGKEPVTAKQSRNERIEAFLRERYDFRFSTVKSRTEFRQSGTDGMFSPLTKFDINSIRPLPVEPERQTIHATGSGTVPIGYSANGHRVHCIGSGRIVRHRACKRGQ